MNAADVVQAGVPLPTFAAEGMCEASCDCMAFENENSFSGLQGQQGRNPKTSDTRADDHGVIALRVFEISIVFSHGAHDDSPQKNYIESQAI